LTEVTTIDTTGRIERRDKKKTEKNEGLLSSPNFSHPGVFAGFKKQFSKKNMVIAANIRI